MTVRVETLIIGNEILSGHTKDTNSQWITKQLLSLGLSIKHIAIISDDVEAIAEAIKNSCNRGTQLLFTSGGLGPTYDDRTAEGLALAAGTTLKLNQTALEMVKERYKTLHTQGFVESDELTPARKKMAMLPNGAQPLHNSIGTAPGIGYMLDETQIFCLPGVPQEFQVIFIEEIQPRIATLSKSIIMREVFDVPILDESVLAPILDKIMSKADGVYLKSTPRPYQSRERLRVIITVTGKTKSEAQKRLDQAAKVLSETTKTVAQI